MSSGQDRTRLLKPLLFALCLLPLLLLVGRGIIGSLGPNPVEVLTHETGNWALRLLLLTLAVTPVRRLTGQVLILRFRRMLGLFAFFYAALHLLIYLWLDQFWGWSEIAEDVLRRPYILVGWLAFVLMMPLAITSTQSWMRRLGRRWKQLHRIVYAIAILAVLHVLWLVKADLMEPAIYALILALLLAMRVPWAWLSMRMRRLGSVARER
ncbi:sulfoxide reductase heme-binding subunit YedZ [Thiocapsa imhoffii]|uniref:Protein-methionine-sulfoxide reductase heme-binding subunit MsrQ n=1 Tax=Thiocapsa imhoffii TaxID=382777 RepID=A0A9X0WJG7_9GAMM|nr:protein-methionine-sulfoxide reductase heme-binding subunit MsrQ [Thiocapsa imhoffii]MBK1645673.1 sulfoxide reductase heme-binding subunit YedZ [Thiocapsa imhoffii]